MPDAPPADAPVIRAAGPADADAARACVVAAFEPYIVRIGKPPAPMLLDFPASIAAGRVWVAERDAQVDGVLVQYETPDGFYIDTVASSPRARGTGVGRALLLFAEAEARRRGYASIYLATNSKMVENQRLYSKVGYVQYDRQPVAGYDRLFYRKPLA
jgi:GNAT superfamily N-acetyltransferase